MRSSNIIFDIMHSGNRTVHTFSGKSLVDALQYGFGFVESEDHFVGYLITNSKTMKKILAMDDSVLEPNNISLGNLWTAKLLILNKLKDRIIFSNEEYTCVLDLNLNPNIQGSFYAVI